MMLAFKDTAQTKAQALDLMREHQRLDHIVQGTYGRGKGASFKGCLVGCATHGDHMAFEAQFGIPWRVAWLADDIFERLNEEAAKAFPVQFFEAIPEGADLSRVFDAWCAWMLSDPEDGLTNISDEASVASMSALFARAAAGDEPSAEEWEQAARAARAAWAAWAAWAARDAWAAWDARAAWAAWAARAAWAAWAARDAWAAWAARDAMAAAEAYPFKMRDKLLQLLRQAPIPVAPR